MSHLYFGGASVFKSCQPLKATSFKELTEAIKKPKKLSATRDHFHALRDTCYDKSATSADRMAAKKALDRIKLTQYVIPCTLKPTDPDTFERTNRKTANALTCNLVCLDVDDHASAVRLGAEALDSLLPWSFMAYYTVSSKPDAQRIRVIIKADEVPIAQYPAAVRTVAQLLGVEVDPCAETVCQPMFWPIIFEGETEDANSPVIVIRTNKDAFTVLDVDSTLVKPSDTETKSDQKAAAARAALAALDPLDALADAADPAITCAQVSAALAHISPDCEYNDWLKVAMALKHQSTAKGAVEEDWFAAFDLWSSFGDKYPGEAELRKKWDRVDGRNPDGDTLTVDWVFSKAKAAGWTPPLPPKGAGGESDETVDAAAEFGGGKADGKAPRSGRRAMREDWVYCADSDKFIHIHALRAITPTAFDHCFGRLFTDKEYPDRTEFRPRDMMLNVWRVPTVEGTRYAPEKPDRVITDPESGRSWVNSYQPTYCKSDPTKAADAEKMFTEHLNRLTSNPVYRQVLINWFAWQVQRPGEKIVWAVYMCGPQGCGKSVIFADVLRAVVGPTNVKSVQMDALEATHFNDWAADRSVVIFEETSDSGKSLKDKASVVEKMKTYLTDNVISLTKKRADSVDIQNRSSYVILTNHLDAFPIEAKERRFFVLNTPYNTFDAMPSEMKDPDYFRKLSALADTSDSGLAGGLRSWLETFKIDEKLLNPKGRAMETECKAAAVEASKMDLDRCIEDILLEVPHPLLCRDMVSARLLRKHLNAEMGIHAKDLTDRQIGRALRKAGFESLGHSHRVRVWEGDKKTGHYERHYMWIAAHMDPSHLYGNALQEEVNKRIKGVATDVADPKVVDFQKLA